MKAEPHRIAACVLAAGESKRMGQQNKLLASINGKTLLHWVLQAIQDSNIQEVCVVTGHESGPIRDSTSIFDVKTVDNRDFDAGMSTSIRLGVENLGDRVDGVMIFLGDMPFVSAKVIDTVIAGFRGKDDIVVPTYSGHDGNPLLWSSTYFCRLKNLRGDRGAKCLLRLFPDKINRIEVGNVGIVLDIDNPATLELFRSKFN